MTARPIASAFPSFPCGHPLAFEEQCCNVIRMQQGEHVSVTIEGTTTARPEATAESVSVAVAEIEAKTGRRAMNSEVRQLVKGASAKVCALVRQCYEARQQQAQVSRQIPDALRQALDQQLRLVWDNCERYYQERVRGALEEAHARVDQAREGENEPCAEVDRLEAEIQSARARGQELIDRNQQLERQLQETTAKLEALSGDTNKLLRAIHQSVSPRRRRAPRKRS
jgi:chromosome segregation ATPase